ncbi:MAG TPA: copper amine oxidase N-terminal domain-containing protein [Syntrophomonadaceae bacterium]|nr:copper amine oxidase N-terminal domain-containing protein [Syntrophomonadaceae bacterium]
MRKSIRGLMVLSLTFVMLFGLTWTCLAASQTVDVNLDGTTIKIAINGAYVSFDQKPYISKGRLLVPLRSIAEALGALVDWDPVSQKITVKADKTVTLTVGSATALVDGKSVALDAPLEVTGGRVMVPLYFIGEALGASVTVASTMQRYSYVPDGAPWEFYQIEKVKSGLMIETNKIEWQLHDAEMCYSLNYTQAGNEFAYTIVSFRTDNDKENIKTILKVLFPTGYADAYNMVMEASDKAHNHRNYDEIKVIDGRNCEFKLVANVISVVITPAN